jgi:hypothetical protein
LGSLAELDWLSLNGNHLSGSLPSSLTVLWLSRFWFDATDLCEPGDAAFQSWLGGIGDLRRTDIMCGVRSLSGTVWHDVDGDGSQDPQEPVLRGVTALLSRSSGSLAAIAAGREVVTDGRGIYRFANLAAGAYEVALQPAAAWPMPPDPVEVVVPPDRDVTVPPIGLAVTWQRLHLPVVLR